MLTEAQKRAMTRIDRTGTMAPADRELLPGLHWCPDWDYLPVCDESPEKAGCTCNFGRAALEGE